MGQGKQNQPPSGHVGVDDLENSFNNLSNNSGESAGVN